MYYSFHRVDIVACGYVGQLQFHLFQGTCLGFVGACLLYQIEKGQMLLVDGSSLDIFAVLQRSEYAFNEEQCHENKF